jgi:hypothetical protein
VLPAHEKGTVKKSKQKFSVYVINLLSENLSRNRINWKATSPKHLNQAAFQTNQIQPSRYFFFSNTLQNCVSL